MASKGTLKYRKVTRTPQSGSNKDNDDGGSSTGSGGSSTETKPGESVGLEEFGVWNNQRRTGIISV